MINEPVLQLLRHELRSADRIQRQRAINRLADLRPAGAVDWVTPLLSDEDTNVRIDAMLCLHDLGDADAIPHLIGVLERDDATNEEIEFAIVSLAAFSTAAVRDALLKALTEGGHTNVARMKIAMQLWRYDDDAVVDALKSCVSDDTDRNVRSHAADSLWFLYRVRGAPAHWRAFWENASLDPEIGVAEFASRALGRM